MIRGDRIFESTRSEFLYQNIAYFLFINQQINLTTFNDEEFRSFLLAIIEIFFGGSTPENTVAGIKLFLGEDANVVIRENYIDARDPSSGFDISDQFGFRVDFEITDEIARNFSDIFQKVLALCTIIKPAHTLLQLRSIFADSFDATNNVIDESQFDHFDYFYDDVRKYCRGRDGVERLGHKTQQCIDSEDVSDQFLAGPLTILDGSAFIEAFAFLTGTVIPAELGAGDFIGSASLTGEPGLIFNGLGSFVGTGDQSGSPSVIASNPSLSLTGLASFTGAGSVILSPPSATLTATASLTGTAIAILDGVASLTATAGLTGTSSGVFYGSASLTATASLTGTAIAVVGSVPVPLAYFSFDNIDLTGLTILDGMGLNDATNINCLSGSPGQVGEAFTLDGISSYISIPDDVSLESQIGPSGTISFSTWINPSARGSVIASKWDSTNNEQAWLFEYTSTGAIQLTVSDRTGTDFSSVVSSLMVATGAFDQVGFTYSAAEVAITDKINLYIGGALNATAVAGPSGGSFTEIQSTTADVLLGAKDPTSPTGFFSGLFDESVFFRTMLSATFMNDIYADGVSGTRIVSTIPTLTSLWTFDTIDYAAPLVIDVIGSNDGTNTGLAATGALGLFNEAFDFDGVVDRIDFLDILDQGVSDFTIGARFKWGGVGSATNSLIRKGTSSSGTPANAGYALMFDSAGTPTVSVNDGTAFNATGGAGTVIADAWHSLIGVIDRTNTRALLYLDGEEAASTSLTGIGNIDTNLNFQLGALTQEPAVSTFSDFFDGILDETFMLSGTALDFEQAKSVSNQGIPVIPSPVGYWSFDNIDVSGSTSIDRTGRNDATIVGATTGATGIINQSYDFTGVGQQVDAGNSADFDVFSSPGMTAMAWVNSDVLLSPNGDRIFDHHDGANTGWILAVNDNGVVIGVVGYATTDANYQSSLGTILAGTDYHIAMSWNASTGVIDLYVNGVNISATPVSTASGALNNDSALPLYIGEASALTRNWDGRIDEPTVWNQSLSDRQIQWLYSEGLKGRQLL